MNKIYDNGELLLGTKKDILEYQKDLIQKGQVDEESYEEIVEFLNELEDNDVVCVNYDNGMGLSFDVWDEKDVVMEVK